MNKTYLYPYSSAEARERNELSLWRESHRANIACRDAIEDAIRRSFDGMHLVWTITSRPNCCGYLIIFVKIMRFRVTQLRKRLH